jgi:hypothetical protein
MKKHGRSRKIWRWSSSYRADELPKRKQRERQRETEREGEAGTGSPISELRTARAKKYSREKPKKEECRLFVLWSSLFKGDIMEE